MIFSLQVRFTRGTDQMNYVESFDIVPATNAKYVQFYCDERFSANTIFEEIYMYSKGK